MGNRVQKVNDDVCKPKLTSINKEKTLCWRKAIKFNENAKVRADNKKNAMLKCMEERVRSNQDGQSLYFMWVRKSNSLFDRKKYYCLWNEDVNVQSINDAKSDEGKYCKKSKFFHGTFEKND